MDEMGMAKDDIEESADVLEKVKLTKQRNNGSSWFYLIAGLSLVNAIMLAFGVDRTFIVGLGATQAIQGFMVGIEMEIGPADAMIFTVFGWALILAIVAMYVAFGIFGRKGFQAAFIAGLIVYSLDALIMLAFQEWLSLAFHALALYGIFGGLRALRRLKELKQEEQGVARFQENHPDF
jgi:hypothetical protein